MKVIRYTRTQLLGVAALSQSQIQSQLSAFGFDITKPITKTHDSDSIYYMQGTGPVEPPKLKKVYEDPAPMGFRRQEGS